MHLRVPFLASLGLVLGLGLAAPAPARAEPPACTGTLSGAFTATFKCSVKVRDLEDGTAVLELQQLEKVEGIVAFAPGSWIIPGTPTVARSAGGRVSASSQRSSTKRCGDIG